jgi:hypothetical protein
MDIDLTTLKEHMLAHTGGWDSREHLAQVDLVRSAAPRSSGTHGNSARKHRAILALLLAHALGSGCDLAYLRLLLSRLDRYPVPAERRQT